MPLTFADPATYDAIGEDDRINVLGLPPVPGETVRCQIVKPDGTTIDFECDAHVQPRADRVVQGRLARSTSCARRSPPGSPDPGRA